MKINGSPRWAATVAGVALTAIISATGVVPASAEPANPAPKDTLASIIANPDVTGPSNTGISKVFGPKTEAFVPESGYIRDHFGAWGSRPVAVTKETVPCSGVYPRIYSEILRDANGVSEDPNCLQTFPGSMVSPIGYQFIYPSDLADGEQAPLIVMSPGISTDPGMQYQRAEKLASHGYVVSLGYNFTNWFGSHVVLAAIAAMEADQNPSSPLHGHIDESKSLLIGHSAGGGSVARIGSTMDKAFQAAGYDFHTRGVVAVNPGPSDFGLASFPLNVPSLFLIAERESLVPHPLSRRAYDSATGPAWWAVLQGAYHGTYLDRADTNAYDGLQLSFIDYILNRSADSTAVYEGADFKLATDGELKDVERKGL